MTTTNRTFVLDSFALLALFRGEPAERRVAELLREATKGQLRLAMTVVNLAEVVYRTIRDQGMNAAQQALGRMHEFTIEFIDVDRDLALRAARLKGVHRMSYADCLVAALAQRLDAAVVTGDPDFRMVEHLVAVEWLPGEGDQ